MRKLTALGALAASLLSLVLVACSPSQRGLPESETAQNQPIVTTTPDVVRVASLQPATSTTQPTGVAVAPTITQPQQPTGLASTPAKPTSTHEQVKRITPAELRQRLGESNPPLVWEVRTPERYNKAHIPGSTLVQLYEIHSLAQNLDRKQAIVTNCD